MFPGKNLRRALTAADARVLIVSQRDRAPEISRCTLVEFEDLITSMDRADVVAPTRSLSSPLRVNLARAVHKVVGRGGPLLGAAHRAVDRDYELLFVVCEDVGDLLWLGSLRAWLPLARKAVCYVEELWARDLPSRTLELELLAQFDHVFLSCAGAVQEVQRRIGKPVTFLPPSVDAIAFCPYPRPPARPIDVYNMGRRSPVTHASLVRLAAERGWFYLRDTHGANCVLDAADHRQRLAGFVKRSKYFVANRAKVDIAATRGQEELGSRHFEGAAGGAVLIGEPPECATFREHFDWEDAVVPMPFDASPADVVEVVEQLEADPDRVARIRAANVRASLLRHDWAYRWEMVLEAAGLAPLPALAARKAALRELTSHLAAPRQAAAGATSLAGATGSSATAPAR
jgi:hypothetical protein